MRSTLPFLAIASLLFFTPDTFAAPRLYRCAGKVQFRPCDVNPNTPDGHATFLAAPNAPGASPVAPHIASARRRSLQSSSYYAKVSPRSLTRTTSQAYAAGKQKRMIDGIWRGSVEGNGLVHLFLEILRGGDVSERRYIGNVALSHNSTTFAFVSSLPSGTDWDWRVRAKAEPFPRA